MAQYMEATGVPTRQARVPYSSDLDGYQDGFFLAARVRSSDLNGFTDEQTIASIWRGPLLSTSLTIWFYLDTDGTFVLNFEETAQTQTGHVHSPDVEVEQGVADDEEFWIGVSVRFDAGSHIQFYWGGVGPIPVWEQWGTEDINAGVTDLRTDSLNDLTVGQTRHLDPGSEDEWFGGIFEYLQFSADFPNIGPENLVAWFNAQDFALNDGDTDSAVGGAGKTWTLASGDPMILADGAVPNGGALWWVSNPSIVLDGDATWAVEFRSVSIEHRVAERSTANLKVWDLDGTRGRVVKGMPIRILDPAGAIAFDGYVDDAEGNRPNPLDTPVGWEVSCIDYHYLADKRTFVDGFTETAAGTIVTAIIDQVLTEEGVTAGTIEAGPVLDEAVFNYVTCSRALDKLADVAVFTWWIDSFRQLHFVARSGTPTATIVSDDMKEPPPVRPQSPDYRNRQVIRGIKGYTDPQTEDFEGDGTLQSFLTSFPIGRVPTVTLNAGAQTVGIRGLDTGDDWYWTKGSNVLSQEVTDTPIISTDALQIVYDGLFDLVAILDDDAEQTRLGAIEGSPSSGIVESVLQVTDVFGRDAAFDIGAGLLGTFGLEGLSVQFLTSRTDLSVGEYVTLDLAEMDVASEIFLVTAIASSDLARSEWDYAVTLIQGSDPGSWQTRLAQGLTDPDVLVIRENISEEQTLVILEQFSEGWTWAESGVTQSVFACPVPSTTLFPLTTLLPC